MKVLISIDEAGVNSLEFDSMGKAEQFLWDKHEVDFADLVFRQCSEKTSLMAETGSKWSKKIYVTICD